MRAKIQKINGIYPVTLDKAVYINGTNKTLDEELKGLRYMDKDTYVIELNKYNIKNDNTDSTNTTAGIIEAIQYAKENGYKCVKFPKGKYLIKSDDNSSDYSRPYGGIKLVSDIEYDLNNSEFNIETNEYRGYAVFNLETLSNVVIKNGIIKGDRPTHVYREYGQGDTHEWGYGIYVNGSKNIIIENNIISDCTGDTICTQSHQEYKDSNMVYTNCENIIIRNNELFNCRRQGISVCSCLGGLIESNNIHNIGIIDSIQDKVNPTFGIDLEGYITQENIIDIIIRDNTFSKILRADVGVASRVEGVQIYNNKMVRDNLFEYKISIYTGEPNTISKVKIYNNNIFNGSITGALNLVSENTVVNGFINCYGTTKNIIDQSIIENNIITNGYIKSSFINEVEIRDNTLKLIDETYINKIDHPFLLSNNDSVNIIGGTVSGLYNGIGSATKVNKCNIINIIYNGIKKILCLDSGNSIISYDGCKFLCDDNQVEGVMYSSFRATNCTFEYKTTPIKIHSTSKELFLTNCIFTPITEALTNIPVLSLTNYSNSTLISNKFLLKEVTVGVINFGVKDTTNILYNNIFSSTNKTLINSIDNKINAPIILKDNIYKNFNNQDNELELNISEINPDEIMEIEP